VSSGDENSCLSNEKLLSAVNYLEENVIKNEVYVPNSKFKLLVSWPLKYLHKG